MQIVIDIDEDLYNQIDKPVNDEDLLRYMIKKGKLLPKGHGRLIDESKITKCEQIGIVIKDDSVTRCLVTDAPTIIEADKEQKR